MAIPTLKPNGAGRAPIAAEDFKRLSREQKLHFIDLLEEKERRLRERRAVYSPNIGQLPVHRSTALLRLVTSGNGSGKTALGANEAIWAAEGWNPILRVLTPVPARVIVLLDHPEKVADVWLPELAKWTNIHPDQLNKRGKPYVSEITFKNGSQILFMFHQQEEMIFESLELDVVIADEPPPRRIYIALRRGGRKKNRKPRFLIIGTPIAGAWLRKEVVDPWSRGELPDTECFKFGTAVNEKNLADGYIESFSRILSEKEKRIRLEGEFFDLDGLALAHLLDHSIHIVDPFEWSQDNPVVVAIDPHPSKAHHAILLGADADNGLFYISELRMKSVPREFARALKAWYRGYRIVDIVVDSLGSSEGTGGEGFKSFIQVLNEEGIRARATTYDDKDDEDFIARVQDALAIPEEPNNFGQCLPKLRFFRGNPGIVSDVENVQWTKYRNLDEFKPKLDITNKDFLSCLKYGLASNLSHSKLKTKAYRSTKPLTSYGATEPKAARIFRMRRSPTLTDWMKE